LCGARLIIEADLDLVDTLTSSKHREEADAHLHC
jgi:hypothetical protein